MIATLTECGDCGALAVSIVGAGVRVRQVGGTGNLKCPHNMIFSGQFNVLTAAHVALSTLLRRGALEEPAADMAHWIQEGLRVPESQRRGQSLPWAMRGVDGISDVGLAVTRIAAANMSAATSGEEAVRWKAAASIMRRRLG